MKSISTKLFLALLSLTVVVLLATLLLARWSFDQGFLDFLNSQQEQRLTNMAADLSVHYSENGDEWTSSTKDFYSLTYLKWFPALVSRPPRPERPRNLEHESSRNENLGRRSSSAEPRYGGGRRPPPRPKPLLEPMVLVDSKGEFIAGYSDELKTDSLLIVDIVVNEILVGQIKTVKQVKLSSGFESSFSKQQSNASYIIAIVSILVASIASWALSRMLLAPTYKMKESIANLVNGDFSNRLTVLNDDELGQLMGDINRLSETLQENRASRRRWLADVSHELRTPIAILSGELEAVLDGIRPLNNNTIESLSHEVARLKHLIDDLYQLSLSDIGGLRYEFKTIDISQSLELIISQQRARLEDAGMVLKTNIQTGVLIEADASRLEQLFVNLINNSEAYTDAPGQISIQLEQDDDSNVVIQFNDSAPGLDTDNYDEIFEPLFREDASRSRRVGGAGLGLSISKNIVYGHEGTINVQASQLGGLEFIIKLPIKRQKYEG